MLIEISESILVDLCQLKLFLIKNEVSGELRRNLHLTSLVEKLVSGSAGSSFSKPSPVKSRKRKTSELPVPDFSNLSKEKDDESTSYSPLSNTGDSTDDIPIENLVDQKSQNEAEKDDSKTENKKKTSKKKEKSKKKEANKSIQAEKKAAATAVVSSDSEIDELWGENPTEALLNKSSQGRTPFLPFLLNIFFRKYKNSNFCERNGHCKSTVKYVDGLVRNG